MELIGEQSGVRLAHWLRAGAPVLALAGGGVSCTGPATGAGAGGTAAVCGAGGAGIGSGQIGSTPDWLDWPVMVALGLGLDDEDCLRACRCGFGLEAAAAAAPGTTGPVGSGFMMLTAGMEAELGKSILTILRGPCPLEPAAGACAASATGASPTLQTVA